MKTSESTHTIDSEFSTLGNPLIESQSALAGINRSRGDLVLVGMVFIK